MINDYIVYQQIVTRQETVKGVVFDKQISLLVRKVKAETREDAIKKFKKNTKKIFKIRGTNIACSNFTTMSSI